MYKYTIQAWNDTALGLADVILIKVEASSEAAARDQASKVVARTNYSVIEIEVLPNVKVSTEIKKG